MATTTSIKVTVADAIVKLQGRLDAHNKAFAEYNKALDKYQVELDKWALKVIKHKDTTKVSVSYGMSISVDVPHSLQDSKPKAPKESDFPGILNSRNGYREVSDVEAIENALGILEIAVDTVINVNAIKSVGSFLR